MRGARLAVALLGALTGALALGGCRAAVGKGYALAPSALQQLKVANHDAPFTVQSEAGEIRIGPETRLRLRTKGQWSEWISSKALRTDARGLTVFRSTELRGLDAIRIEGPSPELLFALQALCAGSPGDEACGAHLRVFGAVGDAPILQVRLRSTCLTAAQDALVVDRAQVPDPLPLPAPDAPGACAFTPERPPAAARLCEQAQLCPPQAWVATAGSVPALPLSAIATVELWDAQGLSDKIVALGQSLRVGRWFFMPDNRFSGGMFEQHGSVQLATTAGEALTGSLGQYLFWALADPHRPAPARARAALRVDRPTPEILRPIREACDEVSRSRSKYEDPTAAWVEPCSAVTRIYLEPSAPAAEVALGQLELSEDDQRVRWYDGAGPARSLLGDAELTRVLAVELAFFPAPLGLIMRPLASYIDRVRWLRWSVYVWDPAGLVPFDATLGQLSTEEAPHYLVERAFVPWDALEGVEVESPSTFDGLFGGR